MQTAIAIFVILFFLLITSIGTWGLFRLHKLGLLKGFLRGKWLASALTLLFMLQFVVAGIAMIAGATWAAGVMRYTIVLWLLYCWIYGLGKAFRLWSILHYDEAKSFGDFIGRDPFFDELMKKAISNSMQEGYTPPEGADSNPINLVTNTRSVDVFNDEAFFQATLPKAIWRKITNGMLGLLIQTAIFGWMYWVLG